MKILSSSGLQATLIFSTIFCLSLNAQYRDYKVMTNTVSLLGREYPGTCTVKSLVRTATGKEIWLLAIGKGEKDSKPAVAVIGGIEGNHISGKELALGFAELLLKNSGAPEVSKLLDKITFYIIPDVSPDASEAFFNTPVYERLSNNRPVDDDRDFIVDEDPFEDLDNNGFITLIRVTDPAGDYTLCPDDERIMIPADIAKGQSGSYFIYTEGIDNDKDGKFNEDGPGGVCFNRNLTFNYEEFGQYAGLHPVSEPEVKAVMDFFYDHFNIFTVFAFSPQDNLGQPIKSQERASSGESSSRPDQSAQLQGERRMMQQNRRITSIMKSDEKINKYVSEKYHEIKGAPPSPSVPGNFMEWVYYHYGRYSFSTPGWWFPAEKNKNPEAEFLKYASENNLEDAFIPWKEIKHPDFPGKKTEAGGLKPFAMINPPPEKLPELITKTYEFILAVSSMHPELEFLDVTTEDQGDNIHRLSLKVHNRGLLATCTEAGDNNMWTRIMRITIECGKDQKLISGRKVQRIQRLEGDKSAEFSWLIAGKGHVKITAGAANTGIITTTAEMK